MASEWRESISVSPFSLFGSCEFLFCQMRSWSVWVTFALQWNGIHPEKWHHPSINQWQGTWLKSTLQRHRTAEEKKKIAWHFSQSWRGNCTIITPPSAVETRRKKALICLNISPISGENERRRETTDGVFVVRLTYPPQKTAQIMC